MFKRVIAVFLCMLIFSGMAFAKKGKKVEAFKEKVSLGYDIIASKASMRLWFGSNLGADISAGLKIDDMTTAAFGLGLVFPIYDGGGIFLNMLPGFNVEITGDSDERGSGRGDGRFPLGGAGGRPATAEPAGGGGGTGDGVPAAGRSARRAHTGDLP